MSRFTHALLFSTLAAACGPTVNQSVCDGSVTQPEECNEACNASPGSPNTCPSGFYCTETGTCNAQCAAGVKECPEGYVCSVDGRCEDDGSGDDVPPPDTENCPNVTFQAMPVTPSIGLVLDRSGSMYDEPDQVNHRYRAMREALVGANGVVSQLETKAYFGSMLYTGGPNTGCAQLIQVPRAINNSNAIRTSIDTYLDRGMSRGENTPTYRAVNAMVQAFQQNPPPADSPPVIVLATDGLPNDCNSNGSTQTQSVQAVAASYAAGIPVYVLAIGLDGQHFQDMANAGQGSANAEYFTANNATELAAAFQTIINGVVSCELSLDADLTVSQAEQGTVTLNGMDLTYGTDWELASPTTIRLLGAACETLKTTTNPSVSAEFPCGVIVGKSVQ
jgi:hypothetical protein